MALETATVDPASVQTNIVIATLLKPERTDEVLAGLKRDGVLAGAMGAGRIRFVTHLDIDDDGLERAIAALSALEV